MIALIGASALALLGLQATINVPRDAFRTCLTKAAEKATTDKVAAAGIEAYLKTACTADANALRSAVIAFDTKNGMARKTAANDADSTVDDYVSSKVDHYKFVADMNAPAVKPAPAPATAPAVAALKPATPAPTPAAVTTPPKP